MARVIDYATMSARRGRAARRGGRDATADKIAEALAYFGGEAHRRMVLDRLVSERDDGEDPELYRLRLITVFEAHCDRDDGRFKRPFGRDSHRWALNAAIQAKTAQVTEISSAL